ncbi:MAG: hypothetical protein HOO67_05950, partial [Candidatus Peribacteraceae bacterium]|nr:hypothetical protein [Candidatus Peribacteraceae bacterium]
MTHTFIHFRSALSFREARLCFQNNTLGGNPDLTPRAPESPVPPTARPPEGPTKDIADKQQIEKDKLAKERKMTVQETQLRTKLLALQVQVDAVNKQIGAKKQNAAAMKTGLEQERTKLDAVGVAVQQLRDSDPQGLAALELEMGVSFTQIQDILRANPSDPNSVRMRQDLIGALGRVSTFTGPELNLSADDVMENIRTFTVGIADSDFVRGGIEQLRNLTRGKINHSQEKVAQMIFQL